MITYNWTVEDVIVNTVTINEVTYTDVVKEIRWRCTGTENEVTAYEEQTWPIGFENPDNFVTFSDLTSEQVINWLHTDDMKELQERAVKAKIERINNTKELVA